MYYSAASVSMNDSGEYRCKSSDQQTKAVKVQVLGKKTHINTIFSIKMHLCKSLDTIKGQKFATLIIFNSRKCIKVLLFKQLSNKILEMKCGRILKRKNNSKHTEINDRRTFWPSCSLDLNRKHKVLTYVSTQWVSQNFCSRLQCDLWVISVELFWHDCVYVLKQVRNYQKHV